MSVRDDSVFEYLKEEMKHFKISLFDLIKEDDRVWLLADFVREESSIVISDISSGRADELAR